MNLPRVLPYQVFHSTILTAQSVMKYTLFFCWAFNSVYSKYSIITKEADWCSVLLVLFIQVLKVFSFSLIQFLNLPNFFLLIIPQLIQVTGIYILVCRFFFLFFSLTADPSVFFTNCSLLLNAITVPLINFGDFIN